jgi:hypothetical protein
VDYFYRKGLKTSQYLLKKYLGLSPLSPAIQEASGKDDA